MRIIFHNNMTHSTSRIKESTNIHVQALNAVIRNELSLLANDNLIVLQDIYEIRGNAYYLFIYVKDANGNEHRVDVHY